jgi:hypothetical protein
MHTIRLYLRLLLRLASLSGIGNTREKDLFTRDGRNRAAAFYDEMSLPLKKGVSKLCRVPDIQEEQLQLLRVNAHQDGIGLAPACPNY